MNFRVLGPVEVVAGDEVARVSGRKERAVLAALIVHLGRARSAEELVASVWGADAPPTAEKSLQVRLSHLRSSMGDGRGVIVRDGRGYRLAVDPEAVDAVRFERLVDEAGRHPPGEALRLYEEALGLVRGRPYADVEEFDGLAAEVRRLDELRMRAIEGRLRALLELGRHAEALPELERLTTDEPHHEGFAALQMLALYRAGRQVEALEAYRDTARRLTELGLDPSEDLRRLERLILEQDERVAAPEQVAADSPSTNLPARLTSFVGRAEELDALRDRVVNHRLVTVAGPGGVGKTSVAVEAARDEAERLRDGAWLVELGPVTGAEELPAAIAGALPFGSAGPDIAGGGQQAAVALAQRLSGRELLLLLDGCEHLADGVAALAGRILAAASDVRIIATSRQPLGVLGEALVELRPFDTADPAAVELFADRARAADPDFSLDDPATAAAVEQICRRLDGLPLALELAAARVRALPVSEIAGQLAGGFTLQPLDEMVAWSFGLLAPPEQELFARLSLFRSPFTLADAQRIGGTHAADALAALVDRSMVGAEGGRYRVLETLRSFGTKRLEERGDDDDATGRYVAWAASLALVHGDRLWSEGLERVFRSLGPRRADLAAASDLACSRGDATAALRLAAAVAQIAFRLGDPAHGRERLATALSLDGGDDAARLSALTIYTTMLVLHGRLEEGGLAAAQALSLAEEAQDARLIDRSRALRALGRLLGGDVGGALEDFEGLEERLADDGQDWLHGFVCGWSGYVHLVLGDLGEARRLSELSFVSFERCDDVWGRLSAAVNLGRTCAALGDYDGAAAALDRALPVAEAQVPERLGPLLYDLGLVELRRQNFERATQLWERCAEIAAGPSPTGGWLLLTGQAERWYAYMAEGHLARMTGDSDGARERYAQARSLLEEVERDSRDTIGVNAAVATSLMFAGEVAEPVDGDRLLREALERAMGSGDRRLVARVLDALAAREPEPETAAALLGAADAVREVAGGPLPDLERRSVEAVASRVQAALGAAYAEAYERGRSDPLQTAYAAR